MPFKSNGSFCPLLHFLYLPFPLLMSLFLLIPLLFRDHLGSVFSFWAKLVSFDFLKWFSPSYLRNLLVLNDFFLKKDSGDGYPDPISLQPLLRMQNKSRHVFFRSWVLGVIIILGPLFIHFLFSVSRQPFTLLAINICIPVWWWTCLSIIAVYEEMGLNYFIKLIAFLWSLFWSISL